MQPPCFECDFSPFCLSSCLSPRPDRSAEFLVRFLVTLGSSGKRGAGSVAASGKQQQQSVGLVAALFPPVADRRGRGARLSLLLQPPPLKELLARLLRYCGDLAAGIAAMPGELAAMVLSNGAAGAPSRSGGRRDPSTEREGDSSATSGQQRGGVRAAMAVGPPVPPPLPEAVMTELDGVRRAAAVRMAARAREKGLPYPPLTELAEGSHGEQNEDVPLNPRHGPYP